MASGTIALRLTSITKAHQAAGFTDSPASTRHFGVGETLKGIRRTIGNAQHGKAPLLSADVRRIVTARREDLLGLRDAALVLVGFAGGFRRSELAGMDTYDLKFSADGVVATVRKSKTDQEGAGREVGLPFGASPDDNRHRSRPQHLTSYRCENQARFHLETGCRPMHGKRSFPGAGIQWTLPASGE